MNALKDELGDLLLQVVFHARMAEEAGLFAFDDVAKVISDKMIRRHPHVFGDVEIASVAAQNEAWEAHKAAERQASGGADSVLDGVALAFRHYCARQRFRNAPRGLALTGRGPIWNRSLTSWTKKSGN